MLTHSIYIDGIRMLGTTTSLLPSLSNLYNILYYNIIPSLMSKQASSVAKLSQVMQFLFSYLHLHLQIVSVISKILPFTFTVRLLISAINRDTAITTPPILKIYCCYLSCLSSHIRGLRIMR